ncbi:hypothetical protein HDU78_007658 [Chytriomyces hyalinus]|nr:hypothetical protein HDU78_007658 [Chytriomyces hyalinus]
MPVLDIQNALSRRDGIFTNQHSTTHEDGSKSSLASSLLPSKIPIPVMVGAAVGACVVAILGALVYRNRARSVRNKRLAEIASNAKSLSLSKTMHRKQDDQNTDPIAQIGINLNRPRSSSVVSNDDCPTPTNKPKLLSMMKQLPFNKKQSVLDSGTMKPVVIPRRKESISMDGPMNLDMKRLPSNGGTLSKSSHRKSSPLTPHDAPSDTVNKVLESMGTSLSKATDSASSSLSSVSTIESDIEVEHRFEVIEPWMPQRYDELELLVGDTVVVYQMFEDGWCDGKLEGSDETGAFPAACLQMDDWSVHAEPSLAQSPSDANEMDFGGSENSIPDVDVEQAARHSHYSSRSGNSMIGENTRNSSSSGSSTHAISNVSRSDPAKHRFSGLLRNIDKFIEEPDAQSSSANSTT